MCVRLQTVHIQTVFVLGHGNNGLIVFLVGHGNDGFSKFCKHVCKAADCPLPVNVCLGARKKWSHRVPPVTRKRWLVDVSSGIHTVLVIRGGKTTQFAIQKSALRNAAQKYVTYGVYKIRNTCMGVKMPNT